MREIPLTQGKVAIVDDEDYEYLSGFNWNASNGYARRFEWIPDKRKSKLVLMHRVVIGAQKGEIVDHINRNKLDNRRCNLRIVTHRENSVNRGVSRNKATKFKGIYQTKSDRWVARVRCGSTTHNSATYSSEEDAAKAYNLLAAELLGDCAYLNDVDTTGFIPEEKHRTSSETEGVSFHKSSGRWRANINIEGKSVTLGYFTEELDAIRMRKFWELDHKQRGLA